MPDISNQCVSGVSRKNRKTEKRFASLFRNKKRKKPSLYRTATSRAPQPSLAARRRWRVPNLGSIYNVSTVPKPVPLHTPASGAAEG
jgi:hypothetical protein